MSISITPIDDRIRIDAKQMEATIFSQEREPICHMRFNSREAMISIIHHDFTDDRRPITQFFGDHGISFNITNESAMKAKQFISEHGEIFSATDMEKMMDGRAIFHQNRTI